MLTRAQISLLQSLNQKRFRDQLQLFVVEGIKMAEEFLFQKHDFIIHSIIVTHEFAQKAAIQIPNEWNHILYSITNDIFEKISSLKTPQGIIVVVKHRTIAPKMLHDEWSIYLDDIQDPGNLGSIIRIADWFGIKNIIASPNTVDCYNSKVLQASMGSILRVHVQYDMLSNIISEKSTNVYGAFMNGTPVNTLKNMPPGIIVIGNEGKGIQPNNMQYITQKIAISGQGKAESLNAAIACGIIVHSLCQAEN